MQLAVSTGLQSHVDPGQGGRDRELADRHLTGPTAVQ
jgi:hypothetical protein